MRKLEPPPVNFSSRGAAERERKAWLRTVRESLAKSNFAAEGKGVRMDRHLANLSGYFGPLDRLGA